MLSRFDRQLLKVFSVSIILTKVGLRQYGLALGVCIFGNQKAAIRPADLLCRCKVALGVREPEAQVGGPVIHKGRPTSSYKARTPPVAMNSYLSRFIYLSKLNFTTYDFVNTLDFLTFVY